MTHRGSSEAENRTHGHDDRMFHIHGSDGGLQDYTQQVDSPSLQTGHTNGDMHSHKRGKQKQVKDNPFLAIQTYISPEGESPFEHGTITDNVLKELDNPVNQHCRSGDLLKGAKKQVLSIQTYTSPERQTSQHGKITNTEITELTEQNAHSERHVSKSKTNKSKNHESRVSVQDGKRSPVVAIQSFFHNKSEKDKQQHRQSNGKVSNNSKQVLSIQTYISPEGESPFEHGAISNNIVRELDNPVNQHERSIGAFKKKQVLSIQTYKSPEGQTFQHGKITNTVITELEDKTSKTYKGSVQDCNHGSAVGIQTPKSPVGQSSFSQKHNQGNGKGTKTDHKKPGMDKHQVVKQVLSIETYISPEGESPFERGAITNNVVKELDNSVHRDSASKDKKKQVLSIQTYKSPEGQTSQHGIITNTEITELEDKKSKTHKGPKLVKDGKESPVLAIQTIASPDCQPPFFHHTVTNTVLTELQKPGEQNSQPTVTYPNVHKIKAEAKPAEVETGVLY